MNKIIYVFLLSLLLLTNSYASYIQKGTYTVVYRFINYAVSPTVGNYRYKILIKDKKVIKVLDLKYGKFISPINAYGLNLVMQTLIQSKSSILTQPKKIKSKKSPYYVAYIDEIKKVSPNYILIPIEERKKELLKNYYKWSRKKIRYYLFRIQDSRLSNKFKEGVELTVKNDKIIKAKDIRTYKDINPNNKYFLTIKKLFGVAYWGIKDAILDYDPNYYYPTYIKVNGVVITSYYLKPLK